MSSIPEVVSLQQDPASLAGIKLYFPPRAQIYHFDSSLETTLYQIVLDGRRFCIDENTLTVLETFRQGILAEEAMNLGPWVGSSSHTEHEVRLVKKLFDKGLLRTAVQFEEEPLKGRIPRSGALPGLFVRVTVIPEKAISSIASLFSFFFHPFIAILTVLGIVAAHLAFIFYPHAAHTSRHTISSHEMTTLIALIVLSLTFHEIGHAAASENYGIHPRALGFGLYWIYPVLYTDVSGSWQLLRWQRLVVGAAGIYFHLIASSIGCVAALALPSRIPVLLVYSIWLAIFLNINPFLQFDGYWILTDILGVPNLRYQTHSVIKRAFAVFFGKNLPDQTLWETSQRTRMPVMIYALAYSGFMLYVVYVICHRIVPRLFVSVPATWASVSHIFTSDRFDATALSILWRAALILITITGLLRAVQRVLTAIFKGVRTLLPLTKERRSA